MVAVGTLWGLVWVVLGTESGGAVGWGHLGGLVLVVTLGWVGGEGDAGGGLALLVVETSGPGWSWGDTGAGLAWWRCWEWVGGGDVRAGLVLRGTQEWVSLGGDIRGGLVWLGTWAGAGVGEDTAFGLVLVGTSEVGPFGRWGTMGGGKTQWVAGGSLWVVALGGGGTPR